MKNINKKYKLGLKHNQKRKRKKIELNSGYVTYLTLYKLYKTF